MAAGQRVEEETRDVKQLTEPLEKPAMDCSHSCAYAGTRGDSRVSVSVVVWREKPTTQSHCILMPHGLSACQHNQCRSSKPFFLTLCTCSSPSAPANVTACKPTQRGHEPAKPRRVDLPVFSIQPAAACVNGPPGTRAFRPARAQ